MTIYRVKTFSDLYSAVARRVKVPTTDTTNLNAIKEIINTTYDQIAKEKKWSWKTVHRDIKVNGKHTTSTVSVTNGDRTVTGVVAGTGTGFTDNMLNRNFYVAGDENHYEIIAVDTVNQTLLLSAAYQGTTDTAATYTIYQPVIGLFPDLDKIVDIHHDYDNNIVRAIGKRDMDMYCGRYPEDEGKARLYTRWGRKYYDAVPLGEMVLGYDFLGQSESYALKLFPQIADEDYLLHVTYTKVVDKLENDDDEPLVPEESRVILFYGALASFYSMQENESQFQYWNALFRDELKKLESDMDDVDDLPELVPTNKYRKRKRLVRGRVNLGSYFDKY